MKRSNSPVMVQAASLALVLVVAACHNHEDPIPPPPGGGGPMSFDTFVIGLIQDQTADDIDPAQVNGVPFEFDEDEHAFDVLFQ